MANIPNSASGEFAPLDSSAWEPVGASGAAVPGARRPANARAALPPDLDPTVWEPVPQEAQYQPIGMDVEGLRSSLNRSLGVQPDYVADVFKISKRTGLDVGTVERNLPEAKRADELARGVEGLDTFMQRNPKATSWLRDPANFGLAKDDLETLGGIEQAFARSSQQADELAQRSGLDWLAAAGGQTIGQSQRNLDIAELRTRQIFGDASPETQAQIDRLKGQEKPRPATDGLLQDIYVNTLGLFPQFLSQAKDRMFYGLQGGLGAGGAAALGSAMTGPAAPASAVISVPTAFATGFGIAQSFGGAKNAFTMEAGGAYDEYKDIPGMDDSTAKTAAFLVGAANAGIEYAQFNLLLKTMPGGDTLKHMLTRQGMREALAVPTVRAALSNFATSYGKTLSLETAQEVLQEAITFLGGQAVRKDAGQDSQGWGEFASRMGETAYQAGTGFAVLTGSGHAMQLGKDSVRAKQAKRMGQAFDEIGRLSSESKLNARLPEAYQDYVEHARRETGGTVPDTVYLSANRLAEAVVEAGAGSGDPSTQADAQVLAQFFQSIGVKPDEAQRMAALNQDVAIPFALYQSKIAPTDLGPALANDVRFTLDGMTRNEAVQFENEFQGRVQEELAAQEQNRAQHDAELTQVIGEYKGELARIGIKGKDADAQLQLLSSGANVAAARWSAIKGEAITPAQWLRDVRGLHIRAVEQGQADSGGTLNQAAMKRTDAANLGDFARLVREHGAVEFFDGIKAGEKLKQATGKGNLLVNVPSNFIQHLDTRRKAKAGGILSRLQDVLENPDEVLFLERAKAHNKGDRYAAVKRDGGVLRVVVGEVFGGKKGERFLPITAFDGNSGAVRNALETRRERLSTDSYEVSSQEVVRAILSQLEENITPAVTEGKTLLQPSSGSASRPGQVAFNANGPRILNQPINADVDPGRRVPIISLDDVTPFELGSKGAKQFLAMWKGAPLVLDETGEGLKARLSSRDADHAFWSSRRSGRDDAHRTTSLAALDAVLRGAVLVETLEAKHGGVAHTHRFYVPVSLNGKTTTLRITTHEMDGKPRAIDGVEVYDVINEKSPASQTAAITVGNGAAGGMQGTLSIRQMLSGVKDSEGRFYFKGSLFHGEPSASRGSIAFTDQRTFISLFKGSANRSTLPHEFGHLFVNDLEAMVATGSAPESVVGDLEKLKAYAGDLSTTEAQERLARGFEAYLREGKAPSAELRPAFQRFSAWLTAIYRDIRSLLGPDDLNDELRGVFDRMLASEDEIAAAEAYYGAKDALERVASDMLTDAEKRRIMDLRGASHTAALEKRIARYVSAYLKALGGKKAIEEEARSEVESQPVYAAADEAVLSGGLSYADVAEALGGVAMIPELNKRRPGLVRDNYAFNAQLRTKHEEALAALRKSQKKDVVEQRSFLSEMFEEGLKNNTAWRIKSFLLYGTDPLGEHAGQKRADKTRKDYKPGTIGLDYDDAMYHFGKQGVEGVQVGLIKRGGYKLDALMQEWGISSADDVLDALHFNSQKSREAFVLSGLAELNQSGPEFRQNRTIGVTLPEAFALKHGFNSAEHLLMEILRSQNKGEAIKELVARKLADTEQALRERLGKESTPGDEDVHSEGTLERLVTEAKALERQIYASAGAKIKVTKPINVAASREVARGVLDGMTLADARDYSRFAAAERRAGIETIKAVKAQKWQEALAAKQREAINHALVLESVKLREEVVKELGFITRVGKSKSMRFEAKEQALSIIQAYELGTDSMVPERPGELQDLATFLRDAFEGDLFNPFDAFPDWLLRKEKSGPYRNLTVADFREVAYLMRSLADVGGSEVSKMATESVTYEEKAAELADVIRNSGNVATKYDEGTKQEKWKSIFRSIMSTMNQQLDMFRKADGYVGVGPENSHLVGKNQEMFERIQAGTRRMLGMQQTLEPAMQDVAKVRLAFAERFRKTYGERAPEVNGVAVPQIMVDNERFSWTAEHVWTIARNIGNGGNRRCLIEGLGLEWGEIQQLLRVLTKEELQAVQREGQIIGSHYAEADKTFRQVYQRPMAQRIEYQPMTIQAADGPVQLEGWYFPIKADAKLNQVAGDRQNADIMKADSSSSAFPPNPRKSFTNARTGAAVPVALSFDVFERGIAEQTRFIAMAPILKDADRVFRQPEYRKAYIDAFGRPAYEQIRPWLKNIATPGMEQADAYDDILSKAKRGATAYILVGNLKSALKQELGMLPAAKEMGAVWMLRGMKALAVDGEMTVDAINAMDPRMKNREKGFDTEQRELLAKARNETVKLAFGKIDTRVTEHDVLKFGMGLQRVFDRHTTYSVWAGAFLKGRDGLNMSEAEAIGYAYRMVERSQVTNTDAAMNAIQRDKTWIRLFSMFMSESFPKGSRMRVDFNAFKAGKIGAAEYARTIGYELIGPVLFNVVGLNLLASVAPDDPKEYFWSFWNELFGVFPVLGGVSGFFLYGKGPSESAAFTGMEAQLKAAQKAFSLSQDFDDENRQAAMFKALIDVAAYKYQVGNVRRFYETAAEGFEDLRDGETKNPLRLVIRKPKGHK